MAPNQAVQSLKKEVNIHLSKRGSFSSGHLNQPRITAPAMVVLMLCAVYSQAQSLIELPSNQMQVDFDSQVC